MHIEFYIFFPFYLHFIILRHIF